MPVVRRMEIEWGDADRGPWWRMGVVDKDDETVGVWGVRAVGCRYGRCGTMAVERILNGPPAKESAVPTFSRCVTRALDSAPKTKIVHQQLPPNAPIPPNNQTLVPSFSPILHFAHNTIAALSTIFIADISHPSISLFLLPTP